MVPSHQNLHREVGKSGVAQGMGTTRSEYQGNLFFVQKYQS